MPSPRGGQALSLTLEVLLDLAELVESVPYHVQFDFWWEVDLVLYYHGHVAPEYSIVLDNLVVGSTVHVPDL